MPISDKCYFAFEGSIETMAQLEFLLRTNYAGCTTQEELLAHLVKEAAKANGYDEKKHKGIVIKLA